MAKFDPTQTATEKTNEILAAASDANRAKEAAKDTPEPAQRAHWPLKSIGIGVGIGSTALVAALLYARKRDRNGC